MKKSSTKKKRIIADRIVGFARYQYAAIRSLIMPNSTDNHIHNQLTSKFVYMIQRDDIGDGAYNRWSRKGGKGMNQSDCRKVIRVIRNHVNVTMEG